MAFSISVCVVLLVVVFSTSSAQRYESASRGSSSQCLDLGEAPQYDYSCSNIVTGVCGLESGFTAPCSQGNGDCFYTSAWNCFGCAQTASNFTGYVGVGAYTSSCQPDPAPDRSPQIVFQAQPFITGSRYPTEGEVIVPLPAKVERITYNSDGYSPRRDKTDDNTFDDGFERSIPTTPTAPTDFAFLNNIFYSGFIVDAPDSMSDTTNLLFNGVLTKPPMELTVGVGVALSQPTNPLTTLGKPVIRDFYQIDPLGAASSVYVTNIAAASPVDTFLAMSNRLGTLNFSSQLQELIRYHYVNASSPMRQLKFTPSTFSGDIAIALHPKSILRQRNSLFPSIVTSATMPVKLDDVLNLQSDRLVQDTTVQLLRNTTSTTTLFSGSFPRLFSFSVSQSRRVSSTLLHKSWNVFGAGSQDRRSAFITSPMASVGTQPARGLLVPFSLFRDNSEKSQVLARVGPTMAQFFFELVYPLRIDILPTVAKVIIWSDGSYDMFRWSMDDNVPLGTPPSPLTAPASSIDSFSVFAAFYSSNYQNPSTTAKIVSYQRVDGEWISAVYFPGSQDILFFGKNTYSQFGQGDGNKSATFPITTGPLPTIYLPIQSVAIGETHVILLTTNGSAFISGLIPANQTLDCYDGVTTDLSSPLFREINLATTKYFTAFNNSRIVANISAVAAGYYYTALIFRVINQMANATQQAYNHVVVCGGVYMTRSINITGNMTELSTGKSPWGKQLNYSSFFPGRYHFCVSHTVNATSRESTIICYGRLDVTSAGSLKTDPAEASAFWNSVGTGLSSDPFSVSNVETISCGQHHVVMTMLEGREANTFGNAQRYATFRAVFSGGSNSYGQLGAAMRATSPAASGMVHPRFSFPERIASTRGPNVYITMNKELSDTDPSSNHQLFETVSAFAFQNNTYVIQRSRIFNTPNLFMSNYSMAAHQRPPDGKYSLTTIFADAVPEWNPFNRSQIFSSATTVNITSLVWDVRFTIMKGLALFIVQNQTAGDGHWQVPPGIPVEQRDCTFQTIDGFTSSSFSSGTFFRDWSILRRNITWYTNRPIRALNMTHNVTETKMTILLPSLFFQSSDGTIYPLNTLSQDCGGVNGSWCDPITKTIICNWGEPTPRSGYQKGLGGGSITWMALFVSIEPFNISLFGSVHFNNTSVATAATNSTVNSTDPAVQMTLQASVGAVKMDNRNTLWFCEPKKNIYDCSSLVFYQSFFPTRKSPSSFFAYSRGGLVHTELPLGGGVGLVRLSIQTNWRRIFDQCVFLKLGRYYYYVWLQSSSSTNGDIKICSYPGLNRATGSQTITITQTKTKTRPDGTLPPAQSTAVPIPADPTPNPPPLPPITYLKWEQGEGANIVRLHTIDKKNNLISLLRYTNSTPNYNLDPYNVTMVFGGHGAVAKGFDGSTQPTAYMLFVNESVQGLLQEQRGFSPSTGAMSSATNFFISPTGSYGSYFLPVIPMVKQFNVFALWIQPEAYVSISDAIVVRLAYTNQAANIPSVQFSVSSNGTTVELIDENIRVRTATKAFYFSICVRRPNSRSVLSSAYSDSSKFYCTPRPLVATFWTRISLEYDNSVVSSGIALLYMDSDLVGAGTLPYFTEMFANVVGVEITLRNRNSVIPYGVNVREVLFCYDYTSFGVLQSKNPFPCYVNSKPLIKRFFSNTTSQSASTTQSTSDSSSVTVSDSPSSTGSTTTTISTSLTTSQTDDVSTTDTTSFSATPTNFSLSRSLLPSVTHSKTKTIFKNVTAFAINLNVAGITAYNIRKTGVPLILALQQDEFNPIADWRNSPNAYMVCVSNVSRSMNPSGFCASFEKSGFASGIVMTDNRSHLQLTIGPALWYNSYQDEAVTLLFLSSAAASEFYVPGAINFSVAGLGYRITNQLRLVEGSGALFALVGMAVGGPASNVMRIATNSIFLNFHCFNDEHYPLSWLMSPTAVTIQNNLKLGVAVVNLGLFFGLFGIHFSIVLVVYMIKKDTLLKAQGDVYFPGLTFGIAAILLPGYISGAWQGAAESHMASYLVLVAVCMIVVALMPMLFLIQTLYDLANFCAKYVPFAEEAWRSFQATFPFMAYCVPRGSWRSTDRHYSFVRRFYHLIWEYRDTRQHWFCVELGEALFVGSIAAITNSSPVTCVAQLFCFVIIKAGMFGALIFFHPHNTALGQWPAVLVSFFQALSLIFVLIDSIKGGTNAYQSAYTVMLFVVSMILMVHSLLVTIMLLSFRYHQWKERKLMRDVAGVYSKASAQQQTHVLGDFGADMQKVLSGSDEPVSITYLPDGTIVAIPDIPVKRLLQREVEEDGLQLVFDHDRSPSQDDDSQSLRSLSDNQFQSFTSASLSERITKQVSPDRIAAHKSRRDNVSQPVSRNIWNIVAMEALTGEPMTTIPFSDDGGGDDL